jgi:hypothetical protein
MPAAIVIELPPALKNVGTSLRDTQLWVFTFEVVATLIEQSRNALRVDQRPPASITHDGFILMHAWRADKVCLLKPLVLLAFRALRVVAVSGCAHPLTLAPSRCGGYKRGYRP